MGSNLVAALAARPDRPHLIVIDTFRTGTFRNIVQAFDRAAAGPFTGEVIAESTAAVDWTALVELHRPAAVFHEAAITDTTVHDEAAMLRENVDGFVPLLEACAASDTPLVYASSAATYGTPPQAARREPFPLDAAGRPDNVYGFSKWLMESAHRELAAQSRDAGQAEPRVVGLRYFNVFGPGEAAKGKMASMACQLTRQMLEGRRPRLFTGGEQARDQVHVDDVVECTIAAAALGPRKDPAPGVYNLGSGRATTYNQIVDAARAGLGLTAEDRPTEYFDMPEGIRRFYQDWTLADLSATTAALGWSPRRDPVAAVREYAAWLAATRPLDHLTA